MDIKKIFKNSIKNVLFIAKKSNKRNDLLKVYKLNFWSPEKSNECIGPC